MHLYAHIGAYVFFLIFPTSLVPARACWGFQCSFISGSLQWCHIVYNKRYNFWMSIWRILWHERMHLHGLSVQRFLETYTPISSWMYNFELNSLLQLLVFEVRIGWKWYHSSNKINALLEKRRKFQPFNYWHYMKCSDLIGCWYMVLSRRSVKPFHPIAHQKYSFYWSTVSPHNFSLLADVLRVHIS